MVYFFRFVSFCGRALFGLLLSGVLALSGCGGGSSAMRRRSEEAGTVRVAERYGDASLRVDVTPGEAWLHDFPLLLGLKRRNAPQMAVWVESPEGRYLATLFVTHRAATQSWRMAGGNRRREALPHWSYRRGVRYADGLYLPTKESPLSDAVTGATPRGSFEVGFSPDSTWRSFVVKVEVNHSTDFNDAWPRTAREGDPGWSGGPYGSGQPALVYAAEIDPASGRRSVEARLVGHSSPDGSDGRVTGDLSGLTSALRIVGRIVVRLPEVPETETPKSELPASCRRPR